MAWLLEGKKPAEIARELSTTKRPVSYQAVYQFRDRHKAELEPAIEEIERQITDYAIANKVARVAELQHLYDVSRKEIDEYGVTIVETRHEYAKGEEVAVIETRDYRASLVREARGILHQAAEEMGQLPKAADVTVNIDKALLVRYVEGPNG